MPAFSINEIVSIEASLVFANLAYQEIRPRRRRAAGRQSTIANIPPQRAPLGTPSALPPNTPFSHIQVITKLSPERRESMEEDSFTQAIFRKPSLMHEAEAVIAITSQNSHLNAPESIANNTQGTTFAAKARAAELQAARARKQLKDKENFCSDSSSLSGPHEVMTFTKSRPRGPKNWKPLNLDNLPEALADGQTNADEVTIDATESTDSLNSNEQSLSYTRSDIDTMRIDSATFPRLAKPITPPIDQNTSPASKSLAQAVGNYDASQWDPDLPSVKELKSEVSNNYESSNQATRVSSAMGFHSIPVLPGHSEHFERQGYHLSEKQAAQLAILQAQIRIPNESCIDPFQTNRRSKLDVDSRISLDEATELQNRDECFQRGLQGERGNAMVGYLSTHATSFRPTTGSDYSTIRPPPGFALPASYQYQPHQYPAVKGTMSNQARLLERTTSSLTNPYAPPNLPSRVVDHSGQQQSRTEVSIGIPRKMSLQEKQDILLQQLHARAANPSVSGTAIASTRTVLHDPFASPEYRKISPDSLSKIYQQEVFDGSDELPWANRPVGIISPASMSVEDSLARSYRIPQEDFIKSQNSSVDLQASVSPPKTFDDVENWWKGDTRVDSPTKRQIADYLSSIRGEARWARGSPSTTHSAAVGSTSTDESPDSTDVGYKLLVPLLANLKDSAMPGGYFRKWGRVPEWCIDQSPGGNESFFEKDWGAPPARVGRDPRYQPVHHDGRHATFDGFERGWGGGSVGGRSNW